MSQHVLPVRAIRFGALDSRISYVVRVFPYYCDLIRLCARGKTCIFRFVGVTSDFPRNAKPSSFSYTRDVSIDRYRSGDGNGFVDNRPSVRLIVNNPKHSVPPPPRRSVNGNSRTQIANVVPVACGRRSQFPFGRSRWKRSCPVTPIPPKPTTSFASPPAGFPPETSFKTFTTRRK